MSEDDNTKELSDRELLIFLHRTVSELHRVVGEMNERVQRLEAKAYDTQPLPVNFEARFTALEERVGSLERSLPVNFEARFTALEERVGALEHNLSQFRNEMLQFRVETRRNFKVLREDLIKEQYMRVQLEERIELLESQPS